MAVIRAVQGGVRWLKAAADSCTDPRDIAVSVSALVAAERNPHLHLVQRLVDRLAKLQLANGSWSDELWDTTWAARALLDIGCGVDDQRLEAARRFLLATQDSITGTWYEEPFETMLVLGILTATPTEEFDLVTARAFSWLASLQRSDGTVIGTRYTGMAASLAIAVARRGRPLTFDVADAALACIRVRLAAQPIWTSAAWSNAYPLCALLDSGAGLDDPLVAKAVDWFIGSQDSDGKWMHVSQIHDTAMSILALSRVLTVAIVEVPHPRTGILTANKENGTIRVTFHGPDSSAIAPAERLKISDVVRAELGRNQQLVAAGLARARTVRDGGDGRPAKWPDLTELEKAGQYAYGHLVPARIQLLLQQSPADHLRLEIDERLIDLPWELLHDGTDFLCARYALGRQLISDQTFAPSRGTPCPVQSARALIVADPTGDLPAARAEGRAVATLLRERCGIAVDEFTDAGITKRDLLLTIKDYDIVHFAGHATHHRESPDESCLVLSDGEVQAFEVARFVAARAPSVVFLNACWSAEELRARDTYSPMMRGLGRTFLYSGVSTFIGYLIPVPDDSATAFAIAFYEALCRGQTVGECVRLARLICRSQKGPLDLMWSSAVLYGDPTVCALEIPH